MKLYDYQMDAALKLRNGNILCGQVGSGKSITALVYYIFKVCRGVYPLDHRASFEPMRTPKDLYIITTAKKRDSLEWNKECAKFGLGTDDFGWGVTVNIDSWNNIKKYKNVVNSFFIFDEQKVTGSGVWVKTFLKIVKRNEWILLSATPGDQWTDYIPVFLANGFYKTKSEFQNAHCVYSGFTKYPKIVRYTGVKHLEKLRNDILVNMIDLRDTERINKYIKCEYDREMYHTIMKIRWNPFDNEPIMESSKLLYLLRQVLNSNPSRIRVIEDILDKHESAIIFYNFDYELEMLRDMAQRNRIEYAEWNGHFHQSVPKSDRWVYLVQYMAGCEGWNCITTDTIIFYSQTYSYKTLEQASGRIDRINTPYKTLYYYHLYSDGKVDLAIRRCLRNKRNFNESAFIKNPKNNLS